MALTQQQVIDLYAGIVRRAPNASELNNGVGLTEASLSNQLFGEAQADVLPFIYFYQAAFNRIPETTYSTTNPQGLDFWVQEFRENYPAKKLWDYANAIVDTPEWRDNIGSLSTVAAITQIYQNVLGRNPDAAGLQYWTNAITTGAKSIVYVLFDISQSAEAIARNSPAAKNLLLEVVHGTADLDGQGSLPDFAPVAPPQNDFALTSGLDIQTLSAGQKAIGSTTTYTDGDQITGTKNNTVDLTLNGAVSHQGVLAGVDNVVLKSQSGTEVNTRGWTGTKTITVNSPTNITLHDLQSSKTQIDIVDANDASKTVAINYDGSKAGFDNTARVSVSETYATVKFGITNAANAKLDTIKLTIKDTGANGDSTLTDLIGHQTSTLEIDGGRVGGKFTIKNALDASLTKIDASAAISNLDLNISEAGRKALDVKLGSGNDTLRAGDSLLNGDKFKGGAGQDVLKAELLTPKGTLTFKSTEIETFDLKFSSDTAVSFINVEDLKTINVEESSHRFQLRELAHDFTNLNVEGKQADAYHTVEYRGNAIDRPQTVLNVNWTNASGNNGESGILKGLWDEFVQTGTLNLGPNNQYLFDDIKAKTTVDFQAALHQIQQGASPLELLPELFTLASSLWYVNTAGALGIKNAKEFHFVHDASGLDANGNQQEDYDTWFKSQDLVVTNDAWQFDINESSSSLAVTQLLTVTNKSQGDLELKGGLIYSVGEVVEEALDIIGTTPVPGVQVDGFLDFLVRLGVNTVASGRGNIAGTNAVRDLSFKTESSGHIALNDVRNVASLKNLTVDANNGDILLNSVGFGFGAGANNPAAWDAARDIETVKISAKAGATAEVNFINGLGDLSSPYFANPASIGSIDLTAANRSTVILDGVATGSIGDTHILVNSGAEVRVNTWLLTRSGGNLVVEGAGELNEDGAGGYWVFAAQGIKNQNFSKLSTDTAHVSFLNDTAGVNFIGTDTTGSAFVVAPDIEINAPLFGLNLPVGSLIGNEFDNAAGQNFYGIQVRGDAVLGGKGNDTFKTGAGDDFVYTGNGNDTVDLGAGNDFVVTGLFGRNDITLGAGRDTVFLNNVGTRAGTFQANNIIADFLSTEDQIVLDLSNINAALNLPAALNGANPILDVNGFHLIGGDGNVLTEGGTHSTTLFQTVNGGTTVLDNTTVLNVTGSYASVDALQIAIQAGGAREIRKAHATWDHAGENGNLADAILVTWEDTTGSVHLSAAKVVGAVGVTDAWNFEVVDIVQLQGVSTSQLNQNGIDWVA